MPGKSVNDGLCGLSATLMASNAIGNHEEVSKRS
jgi:hypothetical protein